MSTPTSTTENQPPVRRSGVTKPANGGETVREEKDNTGVLFFLDQKKTDKHPDATGKIRIEGSVYGISAWSRRSEAGKDYLSISVHSKLLGQ